MNAKRGRWPQPFEPFRRQCVGDEAVDNDPDLVPACREPLRQVVDMAEQAAHRRAENLQYPQRLAGHC
jgi:chemotaxis regulatin CheY-phosphate phosphatase CheZ